MATPVDVTQSAGIGHSHTANREKRGFHAMPLKDVHDGGCIWRQGAIVECKDDFLVTQGNGAAKAAIALNIHHAAIKRAIGGIDSDNA
jgi:hypothetical protein